MTKEYHKSLVEMIKKYAIAAPDPGPGHTKPAVKPAPATTPAGPPAATPTGRPAVPGPTDTAKPAGQTSAHTTAFSPAIKKMQEALIALSRDVDSQLKVENVTQSVDGKATQEAREANQRASFSNFIAKHMMREEVPATEFDPSSNVTKVENKKPSEATRMTTIMDTMRRVGGEKNEIDPDGKWGDRTNQALKNANSLAYALLKLAGDFKIEGIKSYSEGSRTDFKAPENSSDWSYHQKVEYAPILTQHITAIRKLFHEIRNSILENPEYQTYIEGNTPFITYKKSPPLTQTELALKGWWSRGRKPRNYFPVSLPQPGAAGSVLKTQVNYTDLVSSQSFDAWWNGPEGKAVQQPGVTKQMVLDAIKQSLNSKLSGRA